MTATLAVWDAVVAVIVAEGVGPVDSQANDLLNDDRVYRNGEVPESAANALIDPEDGRGYFLIGMAPESEAGFYNGEPGQLGLYRIHCWSRTPTNAERLYQWLKALLHDQRLTLDGHTQILGTVSKGNHSRDPSGKAWQVPANYDVETVEA